MIHANLGIGDYEFAIDDPNGPYQNDPFFENVRPGIHTIYIRDRNDCGIAQIDVSVIGYKKFFTPNGDGIHDSWRILGIREDFQPNSRVYIFDRYGKLLKELDPITLKDGMAPILEDLCHKLTTGSEYSLKMEESLKDTLAL